MDKKINERKKYTQEDDNYIEEKWGKISLKAIAKNLGRSETGIERRAMRLGLGGFVFNGEFLTTGQCAKIVGVDPKTIKNWIKSFGLKANYRKINVKYIYRIEIDDFVKFLKNNQHLYNATNIEEYALGQEYEWLKEKRKLDATNTLKSNTSWTTKEEREAIKYFREGLSCSEIAKIMNRTPISLRKKRALFIKNGIEGIESAPTWSDFQKAFVTKHWTTMDIEEISKAINKPISSIERYAWDNKLGNRFSVEKDYLTALQISKMLKVNRSTVLFWISNNKLKSIENNRGNKKRFVVHIDDLKTFLKERGQELKNVE